MYLLLKTKCMKLLNSTFLLRFAIAVILLFHSIPGLFNNGINEFGKFYLAEKGFGSLGVPLAWAIKLSHILSALCLLLNKYVKWAAGITIVILLAGIFMLHLQEGWYVVGAGRNGIEFNVLMICVLIYLFIQKDDRK